MSENIEIEIFHHGKLSRREAEDALRDHGNYSWLIRFSENENKEIISMKRYHVPETSGVRYTVDPTDFLMQKVRYIHRIIYQDEDGFFYLKKHEKFMSLGDLLSFYMRNPLVNRNEDVCGLPPFLDPDLQVSQRLVPILMSEETLAFGMERVSPADGHDDQNLLDATNDGESGHGDVAAHIDSKEATMLRPTPTHMEAERDENGGDNMSAPQVDVNGEAAGRDPNSEAAAAAEESNDKVIYATIIKGTLARQRKLEGPHVWNDVHGGAAAAAGAEQNIVACPSCSNLVPERTVNAHLDDCLARGEHLEKETVGGTNGNRASQTQSQEERALKGGSVHQKVNFFEGRNSHLSAEVARQFRRDFSVLQLELEGIKDSFSRFESRMRKMSVAVAAHLGEATFDTNNNGGSDSEHIREEVQVAHRLAPRRRAEETSSLIPAPLEGAEMDVIANYSPLWFDELQLRVGERVIFLCEMCPGWFKGRLGTKVGAFPGTHVQPA